MPKKLVIKNNVVENIIEADETFILEGCMIVDYQEGSKIGYSWDGSNVIIPEPEPISIEFLSASVRRKRDALLAETDWWMLSDHVPTQEQISYRQALRDLPQQEGFPFNIEWPVKP